MLRLPSAIVDLPNLRLERGDHTFELTSQEAQLLAYLAERPGQAVPREELHTEVFGYAASVVTRAADAAISRLRAKLEADPRKPRSLLSVRGKGYRLEVLGAAPLPASAPSVDPSLRGRTRELAMASEALDTHRVVQLVGPGGAGKTRLARELCTQRSGRFFDLSVARSSSDAWASVAASMGLQSGRAPIDRVRSLGHALSAGGRMIVFDNLEQLPEGFADELSRLLLVVKVPVVLTSRGPLSVDAPCVRVGPLDETSAMQVLTDAARRASPSWRGDGAPSLRRLAAALDHLPLAMELVGARLPVLGVEAVLERLGALVATGADAQERHGSLFAAIRWSWSLLSLPTQRQLAWWSVFRGSIEIDLAEQVSADPSHVLQAIDELQATALLDTQSGNVRPWVAVRAFAHEQLIRLGERGAAQDAHAQALFRACPPRPQSDGWTGPDDDVENWAIDHRADLLAAAGHSAARHPEMSARLGITLLLAGSRLDGVDREAIEALAAASSRASNEPTLVAEALILRANHCRFGGYAVASEPLLAEAEKLLVGHDRMDLLCQLHRVRANDLRRMGHLDDAERVYRAALEAAEGAGLQRRAAQVLQDLGATARRTGRLEEARELHLRAQGVFRRLGDTRLETHCLMSLASIERVQGRPEAALRIAVKAVEESRRAADPYLLAECLSNASNIHSQMGQVDEARALLDEAIRIERAHGHLASMTYSLGSRGGLEDLLGRPLEAEMDTREALLVAEQAGVALPAAFWRYRLAEQAHRRGALGEARALYDRAITELDAQHAHPSVDHARAASAVLLAQQGDEALARERLAQAAVLKRGTRDDLRVFALTSAAVAHLLGTTPPDQTLQELGVTAEELRAQPLLGTLCTLFRSVAGDWGV